MSDKKSRIKNLFRKVQIGETSCDGRLGLLALLAALFSIFGATFMLARILAAILRIEVRSTAAPHAYSECEQRTHQNPA
jgi:hypothetical protein